MVDERRQQLLGAQLRGLVGDHLGVDVDDAVGFGAGVVVVSDGVAWALVDGVADRRLGAALAWALRHDAVALNVIASEGAQTLARRSRGFSYPIDVWTADQRTLRHVEPAGPPPTPGPVADHLAHIDLIEQAGAVPHVEFGVVTGEVRGLEVCRVVDEPTTGNFAELSDVAVVASDEELAARVAAREQRGVILEVGVGAPDREAFQLIHGDVPTVEALAGVVEAVTAHRSTEARQHPLNRMAHERFLRWQMESDPARLDLADLAPAEPPVQRQSMKHAEPCVAHAVDTDGRPAVVVFSAGVDLDLIPYVADVTLGVDADVERMVVAVPERDLVAITSDMADHLVRSVELVGLSDH